MESYNHEQSWITSEKNLATKKKNRPRGLCGSIVLYHNVLGTDNASPQNRTRGILSKLVYAASTTLILKSLGQFKKDQSHWRTLM